MEKEYSLDIARHYAAYRPPLHSLILERCLGPGEHFEQGLDIGSGTGQSTLALTRYCNQITGLEPSRAMLEIAIRHPQIEYRYFDGKKLPMPDQTADLVTFAGSLFYGKSQQLLDETLRVSREAATILIYDFEVLCDRLFLRLNIQPPADDNPYDHTTDFSGLNQKGLEKIFSVREETAFTSTPQQLGHLLLSYQSLRPVLTDKYRKFECYDLLVSDLTSLATEGNLQLAAIIYYTRYRTRV